MKPRRAALLSALAGFVVYLPTVGFGFVWDDTAFILQNEYIRHPLHILKVFVEFFSPAVSQIAGGARPLWVASLAADFSVWGMRAGGFHFTNVLLHAANCGLAALIAFRLFGAPRIALGVGLAFALHPIHVESVAAIGFRTDLLAFLFAGLAFLLLDGPAATPARRAGALACYGLGLLAKEAMAPLPAVLFVWEALNAPRERLRRTALLYAPFAVLLALYVFHHEQRFKYNLSESVSSVADAARVRPSSSDWADASTALPDPTERLARALPSANAWAVDDDRGAGSSDGAAQGAGTPARPLAAVYVDPAANVATMSAVFGRYVGKMLFPFRLCADYDVPVRTSLLSPPALGSLALFFGGLVLAWRVRRSDPALAWGLAWFYLFLAPVSNIVPLVNLMAERYLYIPSLGFLLAAAAALRRLPWKPRWGVPLAAAVALAWTAKTAAHSFVWRNAATLFTETIHCAPRNFRAWYNAGLAYQREGLWEKALSYYRQAAERGPHRGEIYVNMGRCHEQLGNPGAAEVAYREALRLDPADPLALLNLGNLRYNAGDLDAAVGFYVKARDADRSMFLPQANLGKALVAKKDFAAAQKALQQAIWLNPSSEEVRFLLGVVADQIGTSEDIYVAWETYLQFHPGSPHRAAIEQRLKKLPPR